MNRGFLCIAYAMLCHSVAYTATIHRFTRTSVLELGKATLSQILLPNNIYRLNIILMAKLQLLAITTLDGYLFDRTVSSPLWDNPNKYGLTKIRERATQTLGPDVSFISLTQWKKKNEGIYFIEAAPDTISVISSMFRYWLVDEIIIFVCTVYPRGRHTSVYRNSRSFLMGNDREQMFQIRYLQAGLQTD